MHAITGNTAWATPDTGSSPNPTARLNTSCRNEQEEAPMWRLFLFVLSNGAGTYPSEAACTAASSTP